MSHFLRADTAATLAIGPFVATADGFTPDTAVNLAAANASSVIMKHNGETFVNISARTLNHESRGMYTLGVTTDDTNTEGRLVVFISNTASYLPVWYELMVMNANAYDAFYAAAGTDRLSVDVAEMSQTAWLPTGAPASDCSLASAISFNYAALRNKTVTSSLWLHIRNYSDNATVCTATLSDDGTVFTRKQFI